jgi:hypothetical protein
VTQGQVGFDARQQRCHAKPGEHVEKENAGEKDNGIELVPGHWGWFRSLPGLLFREMRHDLDAFSSVFLGYILSQTRGM